MRPPLGGSAGWAFDAALLRRKFIVANLRQPSFACSVAGPNTPNPSHELIGDPQRAKKTLSLRAPEPAAAVLHAPLGERQAMTAAPRHLRNAEAAALIGIKPVTLKIWRVKGKGPKFVKLGDTKQSGVVYDEEDVLAWLTRRKFRSTSAYAAQALAPPTP